MTTVLFVLGWLLCGYLSDKIIKYRFMKEFGNLDDVEGLTAISYVGGPLSLAAGILFYVITGGWR